MSIQTMLSIVSQCSMFEGLTAREKYYILRFFEANKIIRGNIIIHEGEFVDAMFILATGKWEVFLPKNVEYLYRPTDVHLQLLEQPGTLLGEYSFLDNKPASASIRAMEEGLLYGITYKNFEAIVNSSNRVGKLIYRNLLQALITRLRKHNEEIDLMHLMEE